jgi:hypothetical protein
MNTYMSTTEVATAEKMAVVRDIGMINIEVADSVTLAESGMAFAEDAEDRCGSSGQVTFAT